MGTPALDVIGTASESYKGTPAQSVIELKFVFKNVVCDITWSLNPIADEKNVTVHAHGGILNLV